MRPIISPTVKKPSTSAATMLAEATSALLTFLTRARALEAWPEIWEGFLRVLRRGWK